MPFAAQISYVLAPKASDRRLGRQEREKSAVGAHSKLAGGSENLRGSDVALISSWGSGGSWVAVAVNAIAKRIACWFC